MARIMVLDGHSLTYRAFFALPSDMATASGQVTNAVYGFTAMLINLIKDHQPDQMVVAFDRPEPTFRHQLVSGYKAGRSEAPDILRQQLGLVRKLVETMKIPVAEVPGYEADDALATLATRAAAAGDDVIVVTGDRDTYQLVEDPHIKVLYNRRGVSDYVLYDEAGIAERTGVTPRQYPEFAALRGDPSDNLPNIPGVGEKTAAKLITTYGSIDNIYAHLEDLTPRLRESLVAGEEVVRSNARATPLVRDLPVEVHADEAVLGGWDTVELKRLFDFLEFKTLWDRLVEVTGGAGHAGTAPPAAAGEPLAVAVQPLVRGADAVHRLRSWALAGRPLALAGAWDGPEGRSRLLGLAFASVPDAAAGGPGPGPPAGEGSRTDASRMAQDGDAAGQWTVPPGGPVPAVWLGAELLEGPEVRDALAGLSARGLLSAHDAKALVRALAPLGVDFHVQLDTAIAAYLVDPAGDRYVLEDLAARYAGVALVPSGTTPTGQLDLSGPADPTAIAGERAAAVARLVGPLSSALAARGMSRLYDDVERPLIRVLARMELVGVRVDTAELARLGRLLADEAHALERRVHELAGGPFLVNSVPQLREVLYGKLGLVPVKKTKTGPSTDNQALEKLRDEHPIVAAILRYREVEKLRSTYTEALLAEVVADGRIHATFNQTVARTGRLSSDAPNLHNIPVRSEEGRQLRGVFVPAAGMRFLVADYNQIELRVIAHLAQDPGLVEAFSTGADIHRMTAARIFGVDPADVTIAMRSKAKMVSYGLAYGMEAYGLAQRLGIEVEEAAQILKAYFDSFPRVRSYMDQVVAAARDRGYTETLFGRRRLIPELSSQSYQVRMAGERQAMNAGIQGLAADIFKVALVRLDAQLSEHHLQSRLILQVHDEVILEVPPQEEAEATRATLEAMTGAAELTVPLEVHLSWGDSWADAKT
ncbi:MAG TPA: DNA polymerase I [Acidimicrobiales bacterium]|nr:DNA polymerase I [Acidimicrobiales bacterium]